MSQWLEAIRSAEKVCCVLFLMIEIIACLFADRNDYIEGKFGENDDTLFFM